MPTAAVTPSAHLRTGLALVLALAATLGASLVALAQDDDGGAAPDGGPIAPDGTWLDERYASRPEAALPPSEPYLGPPIGSVFAPSTVIFPEQTIPLRFFHDEHLEIGLDCATCHAGATTSLLASDRLLPAMEVCLDCHAIEDGVDAMPPADCSTCHTPYAVEPAIFDEDVEEVDADTFREVENPPPLMVVPTPQLKFPHAVHTADAGIECSVCHGNLGEVQLATRFNLPTMALCLDCHTGRDDAPDDDCTTCHLARGGSLLGGDDGTGTSPLLLTNLPTGVLVPTGRFRADDHRLDYLETHRNTAQSEVQYCYNCHTESYCEDCHDGVVKVMAIHPPGYVQTHAVEAYADQSDCESCHTTQDFCLGCHQQLGVFGGEGREDGLSAGRFHPEGWVRAFGGEADGLQSEHSKAAQRNIAACASCHVEDDCISCHGTQATRTIQPDGFGGPVNPHPSDWLDTCAAAMERNLTSCIKCHGADDALLRMCR